MNKILFTLMVAVLSFAAIQEASAARTKEPLRENNPQTLEGVEKRAAKKQKNKQKKQEFMTIMKQARLERDFSNQESSRSISYANGTITPKSKCSLLNRFDENME